jgi:DNA polymerase-3 subunit beta
MYIRTNRETLMPVLGKVSGVVERRQTLPILGNFLICVGEDSVEITGTDLEVEIRTRFAADIDQPGDVTLPARKLVDICRALPEGSDLSLKVDNERALIVAGRSRFTLSTLPARDFPSMEGGAGEESIDVEQGVLKGLLEKTAFAMAHQDVRYYLNGLLLEIKEGCLVAVATDGHRLAKVEQDLEHGLAKESQIILPRKTVLELNRLLASGHGQDTIRLDISEKMFRSYVENTVLTSKLVDGRYPDYEKVIPRTIERVAHADRDALRQALLRTSILSNEKYKGVRLSLESGQLRLQAHNPEQEEAVEEIELDYAQEPTAIGFNVGYLMDVLNVLDGDEVELGFTDSNSSATLRDRGKVEETFVVMPMRL